MAQKTDKMEEKPFPQRWVTRAMKSANLSMEQIEGMSYEQLRSIPGFGPKVVAAIWDHLGRNVEIEPLPTGETIFNVPLKSIERARSIWGTWRHFGAKSQEEFDALGVSDEDVARFIIRAEEASASSTASKGVMEKRGGDRQKEDWGKELNRRLQEYLEYFDAPTPNDVAALRNLAFLNMRADILQQDLLAHVGRTDPMSQKVMEGLNKQMVDVSEETRQLEKALGIGRAKRVDEGEDPLEVLRSAMDDAEWLMEQEVQEVVHHCEDGKVIPIMAIWHYFPTHPHEPFKQQCPNCGRWITVEYKERGIALSAKDFEIEDLLTAGRGGRGNGNTA